MTLRELASVCISLELFNVYKGREYLGTWQASELPEALETEAIKHIGAVDGQLLIGLKD